MKFSQNSSKGPTHPLFIVDASEKKSCTETFQLSLNVKFTSDMGRKRTSNINYIIDAKSPCETFSS